MASIYDFELKDIDGMPLKFSDFKGKIILVVNTASKCGLAGQLNDLEELYEKYNQKGFEIIGIPSNQFKGELATDAETANYCALRYGVNFPMTQRVDVNGKHAHPLFQYLKAASGHGAIKWNYTKFLINQEGELVHRFAPVASVQKVEQAIVTLI